MTDATVYAVASGKGGVGKTTTAVNLAAGFADAGRSVVVVDADLGMGNLGDLVEATPAGPTLHEVLAGEATLDDALSHVTPGLDVVLGSDDLELFGRADPRGIRDLLGDLRDRYDVVILDSGAGLSHDTALPLGLADEVILVSTVEEAAVKNTKKTLDLAATLEATLAGIVLTRVGGGKAEVDPTDVAAQLAVDLLGSVPEDSAVRRSAREGETLLTHDRESPAAQAYLEIAYDLLGETLPMGMGKGEGSQAEATMSETDSGPVDVDPATTDEPTAGTVSDSGVSASDEPETEAAVADDEETLAETGTGAGEEGEEAEDTPAESTADADDEGEPALQIEDDGEDEEESRSFLSKITGGLLG